MKEKLIQVLGLDANASEDQVLAAVAELKEQASIRGASDAQELAIRKKIAQSGGALNRENAILAIEHQAEQDKQAKKAKKAEK